MNWTLIGLLILVFIGLTMWHQGMPKDKDQTIDAFKEEGKDVGKDTFDWLKNLLKKENEEQVVITTNTTNTTGG